VGNPATLFADVAASLVDKSALQPGSDQPTPTIESTAAAQPLPPVDKSALQPGTDQSTPTIQPTADAQPLLSVDKSALQPGSDQPTPTIESTADAPPLPPTAKDAPTRDEIAASFEPAGQSQTENSEPASEALFREYQAWVAKKDAQAQVGGIQPVEDTSAKVTENAKPLRPMQKHQHVRPVHDTGAEIRPVNNPEKKVRRAQNARVQVPPAQNARAQDQSVQNDQAPSLLQRIFGSRN
jgi:hypothetical protein